MWCFFFFQAKGGIRDLVRSRGLGDVYKRQGDRLAYAFVGVGHGKPEVPLARRAEADAGRGDDVGVLEQVIRRLDGVAVSYTHLTLPTIYSV